MAEASERRGKPQVNKEAVLAAIAPQIDRLVAYGYHLYTRDLQDTSAAQDAEAVFRASMMDAFIPDRVEDLSKLVLVVPNMGVTLQAELLGLRENDYWQTISQDYDLPEQPYVIEVTQGSATQRPRSFTRRTRVGLANSFLSPEAEGNLRMIGLGLEEKRQRGVNVFELLAFVRERRAHITTQLYALRRPSIRRDPEIPELSGPYFPGVLSDTNGLYCGGGTDSYVPSSMAEILSTRKNIKFPGFSPRAS